MPAALAPELPFADSLRLAFECLGRGDLLGFRTDTLYGISCDPGSPSALAKLQSLKARKDGRGFVSLCRSAAAARELCGPLDPRIAGLMDRVWPGPVTLILPAGPQIPAEVAASDSSWAVRVPDSAWCLELLAGHYPWLPSTSANLPGTPPEGSAPGVRLALGDQVGLIVDSGTVAAGVSASILADARSFPPRVVRAGDEVSTARLQAAIEAAAS